MKKEFIFLAMVLCFFTFNKASAHTFEAVNAEGKAIYYNITSSTEPRTVEVTYLGTSYESYPNRYSGAVIIPDTVIYDENKYAVTSIGYCAFLNCSALASITIPESVINIGDNAFQNCSNLGSIAIPESVTSIGYATFSGCGGLTAIFIPNSVINIGIYAFRNCSNLGSIAIPNSVTSIGYGAFTGCSNLGSITIPASVTSIGSIVFQNCSSLTEMTLPFMSGLLGNLFGTTSNGYMQAVSQNNGSTTTTYYLPKNLKKITLTSPCSSIPYGAFYNCTMLEEIVLPNSLNRIDDSAFYGCSNLASIAIPNGITSIGSSTFYGCSKLASINIPSGITSIGSSTFYGCSKLTSINIPSGITNIGSSAFYGCSNLASIAIPANVTNIGTNAFQNCNNLKELSLPFIGLTPTATGSSAVLGILFGSGSVKQFYGSASTQYSSYAIPPTLEKLTITHPAPRLEYGALSNCSMLKEVVIAGSITELKERALYGCSGLTHIYAQKNIPPTVYSEAFEGINKFTCNLHVPVGSKQYYSHAGATGWNEFFFIEEAAPFFMTALPVPYHGGEIIGIRSYNYDNEAVITAHAHSGYNFKCWMEGENVVSLSSEYRFPVTASRTLYAVFTPHENADENIQISASASSATISWVAVEDAETYLLIIYSDESRTHEIARFELDVDGNILRNTTRDLSCTIPDLDSGTAYYYSLTSYDEDNQALTVSNGDFKTSITGIDTPLVNQIGIFPNPVSENFRISGITESTVVSISDISGKKLLQQTIHPDAVVSVGHLQKGVYLLNVNGKTVKMIKR